MDSSRSLLPFARIDHRLGRGRIVAIRATDASRHFHIIGQTGAGKSVLIERLFVAEMRAGHGVGLLDPHGDLVERLLDFVPRERTNDVVLVDGSEREAPVGLNPLDMHEAPAPELVVSGVLSVFKKVYGESWGPRLEHLLRNALFALADVRDATLLGVLRMLVEERFRARVLRSVQNPIVRFFWEREYPSYPPAFRAEMASPVQNKIAAALTHPLLRGIVGQVRTTVSAREIMDEGRVLLASLAKGRMGEDASMFLGALLLGQFHLAAYARADVAPSARRPFTLYVDEFPSFATESFGDLLVEARKFGLALVLAHQHMAQLSPALGRAVLGNAGTTTVFRVGPEDAEQLAPLYAPELRAEDLTKLARHQIALRLAVNGTTSAPFTAETLPPFEDHERTGQSALIRRISRERYGTPRVRRDAQLRAQLE